MVDICSALSSTTRSEHDEKRNKVYITTRTSPVDTVQRKRLVYKAENAEIVEKQELDDLTDERSFDRCPRCYIFAQYTDILLVRIQFVIHPPLTSHRHARHRCRPCLRRETEFMSSAQAVLLILLNLFRSGLLRGNRSACASKAALLHHLLSMYVSFVSQRRLHGSANIICRRPLEDALARVATM